MIKREARSALISVRAWAMTEGKAGRRKERGGEEEIRGGIGEEGA
jgi:hypothetical protein